MGRNGREQYRQRMTDPAFVRACADALRVMKMGREYTANDIGYRIPAVAFEVKELMRCLATIGAVEACKVHCAVIYKRTLFAENKS